VDASLNNADPCIATHAGATVGTSSHTAPQTATASVVSNFDTSALDPDAQAGGVGVTKQWISEATYDDIAGGIHWYALCYAETSASNAWTDSGIRVSVPRLHTVNYYAWWKDSASTPSIDESRFVPARVMTSAPLATNRLPQTVNMHLEYTAPLPTGKTVAMVQSSVNSGNPCVAAATFSGGTTGTATFSGVMTDSGGNRTVLLPQATLLASGQTFAVCYNYDTTDATWKDSYIRIKMSKVYSLATKGVTHKTTGHLADHTSTLIYTLAGSLNSETNRHISLVNAVLGPAPPTGFAVNYPNPCQMAIAAAGADGQHTGKSTHDSGTFKTLSTLNLDTSLTFALCYASGDGSATDATWDDSGARLTISKVSAIMYSGYRADVATNLGKKSRGITSTSHELQLGAITGQGAYSDTPLTGRYARVLPQAQDVTVVYVGDLPVSKFVSLVALTNNNDDNQGNPCANPARAAAAASASASGPVRACLSYAGATPATTGLCVPNGAGANKGGNKEVVFPQTTHKLSNTLSNQLFTLCYTEGDGTSGAVWYDSYVRVKMSKVKSIVASGVTHTDHGQLAHHESASKLSITYNGELAGGSWLSLVDEQINQNDPCVNAHAALPSSSSATASDCSGFPSGEDTACTHSGPTQAAGTAKVVTMQTNHLDTAKQYAVCYSAHSGSTHSTWYDSGIRVTLTKVNTLRYNKAQLPLLTYVTTTAVNGRFLRDLTSSRAKVGNSICLKVDATAAITGCDAAGDFKYNDACAVGTFCDPNNAVANGGCGTAGVCNSGMSARAQGASGAWLTTTYNHAHLHKLPQIATGSITFQYKFGSIPVNANAYFAFMATSVNGGDPCVVPTGPSTTSSSTQSGTLTAAANGAGVFSVTAAQIAAFVPGEVYTLCYAGDTNVLSWRDSYIRLTLSKIEAISSHGITHRTHGHIARATSLGITYQGTLGAGNKLSIINDAHATNAPCASASSGLLSTGESTANKTVFFDTSTLDSDLSYAVCYQESSTWYDSGIRVTVSRVLQLQYNKLSDTNAQKGHTNYARIMTSTNTYPASETNPISTNRIASKAGLYLRYDVVSNSLVAGSRIALVATDLNSDNNPCMTVCDSDAACLPTSYFTNGNTATELGVLKAAHAGSGGVQTAGTGTYEVQVPQSTLLSASKTFAVCYGLVTSDTTENNAYRDSYIRLKVSKVYSIRSYGIVHKTFGDVAGKAALSFTADGDMATTSKFALVDTFENNQQPCDAGLRGGAVSSSNEQYYSGVSTYNTGSIATLPTNKLNSDRTFAVCYTEAATANAAAQWIDSGLRMKTPQLQSITYSAPVRTISADSCFAGNVEGLANGIANCVVGRTNPTTGASAATTAYSEAHKSIDSILPRGTSFTVTYHGPTHGTALGNNKWISLVEHTRGTHTTGGEANDPCRNMLEAAALPTTTGVSATYIGAVQPASTEGGMREHTGPLLASGTSATVLQEYTGTYPYAATLKYNRLNYNKIFAVCYASTSGTTSDTSWRDSYIRITLSQIQSVTATNGMSVTTVGTFAAMPTLEVSFTGSLGHDRWMRLVSTSENSGKPCDDSQGAAAAATAKTVAVKSLGGSRKLTFDTSALAYSGGSPAATNTYFVVCYADNAAASAPTTCTPGTDCPTGSNVNWHDSGIRLRFVRWVNYQKHRVVSGAPSKIFFSINTGNFDTATDTVVFLKNQQTCSNAPSASTTSDGTAVSRKMDYSCSSIGGSNIGTNCDSNFDGNFAERCQVGALCTPSNSNNGGCGASGVCSASVQLPSGQPYSESTSPGTMCGSVPCANVVSSFQTETKLSAGEYAICVCLGTTRTSTGIQTPTGSAGTTYGPPNGDGGCNTQNEFTLVASSFKSLDYKCSSVGGANIGNLCDTNGDGTFGETCVLNAPCLPTNSGCGVDGVCSELQPTAGYYLRVISEPQLGRYGDTGGQVTLRQITGTDAMYHVKAAETTAGYQLSGTTSTANNDKIVFLPKALGCGQTTKYTGATSNRRWRARALSICSATGTVNVASTCDANFDGVYNEPCVMNALCDGANPNNGGCGDGVTCGLLISSVADAADRTGKIDLQNYDSSTLAATINTPTTTKLTTVGNYSACFMTAQMVADPLSDDFTDAVELTHGLEVITSPRLGSVNSPGNVRALQGSSPSFTVNSLMAQDLIYFMPQVQLTITPGATDCVPHVCMVADASASTNCDVEYTGNFNKKCVVWARCNPANGNHGGCGTTGSCVQYVPTVSTATHTGILSGSSFDSSARTGKLTLPGVGTTALTVPAYTSLIPGQTNIRAWYLVACFIGSGAIKTDVNNVVQLADKLTIFPEPTNSLVTSWFKTQVHELRFTQPQTGTYGQADWSTGMPGDIIVLQKTSCTGVHSITPSTYSFHGTCTSVGGTLGDGTSAVSTTNCDANFDGTFDEQCAVGTSCNPANPNNGGCGTDFKSGAPYGECSPSSAKFTLEESAPFVCVNSAATPASMCDMSYNGVFSEACVTGARCNPGNANNGGCGTGATCAPSAPSLIGTDLQGALGNENGGTALVQSLAVGKVNELPTGVYKICYATASSEGEVQGDFVMLSKTIEILDSTATKPSLTVPRTVQLGADIVVSWSANIDLQTRDSQSNSWLGLFKTGDCNTDTEDRHQCYLAWQFINVKHESGTVIFSQDSYKHSGAYEVRYFQGDTRNGQGTVCRGQENVPSATYVHCVLESAAVSNTITVAGLDINENEDLSSIGFEAVFHSGNKGGRYYRKALN
jgi:hypothetical protein